MALPATLVWEVRPTNGTANAGGGFDPSVASAGTDFSQQNAVQQAYTDLVIDATTNTDITSVARAFTSVDVGNNIAITGGTGFTTGIYNIRSLQAGNKARLDRAVGTTSSTGGTGNLGGARSGFSAGTTTMQGALVAGNKVYVKKEAWNEAVTLSVSGSAGSPIVVEGYDASRGDAPTGSGRPTNDRAGAGAVAITISGSQNICKYLVAKAAGTNGWSITNLQNMLLFCRGTGCTTDGIRHSDSTFLFACEGDSNTGRGINDTGASASSYWACYSHNNGSVGFDGSFTRPGQMSFCISAANSNHGFNVNSGGVSILHCTSYGNTGASTDGINGGTPNSYSVVVGCIFANNGRDGARMSGGNSIFADYNDFNGNAGTARTNFPTGANDSTAAPSFTNAGSGDFSIGTALKALGFPGAFPGGTSTGYLDMGAVQRQESGGGGGGTTIAGTPLLRGLAH